MPKKRKTRKQKERAIHRNDEEVRQIEPIHIDTPTYSVGGLKSLDVKPVKRQPKEVAPFTTEQKDTAYLRHDITAITAASGIIIALEVLLFVLLTSGVVKLNFLGY